MAQTYGGRWQLSSGKNLGSGGQGEVFRVTDIRGEYQGEFALKRVLNPSRHERFRREIEAVKIIQHRNIIKLIDHSALSDSNGEIEKQFLVMPIAEGGDLSKPGRVEIYKDSIDGVIQVGNQLAAALIAAHAAGVIHRDIKPANILFTDMGHETWLSDFGICLLREHTRLTEHGEVVGPRSFLAPELEDGSQLDVTAAADVYSLGKVLYYMVSGGFILPRERLDEDRYKEILMQGERHRLLYSLLRKMVCPLRDRLQTMNDVAQHLAHIEAWEKEAQTLALTPQARAEIQSLQLKAQESNRVAMENRTAREEESERLSRTKESFEVWMQSELEKVAAYIKTDGLECRVSRDDTTNWSVPVPSSSVYVPIGGLGLSLTYGTAEMRHILYLALCIENIISVNVTVNGGPSKRKVPEPVRDHKMAMIPIYLQATRNRSPAKHPLFFTKSSAVGQVRAVIGSPAGRGRMRTQPAIGSLGITSPSFHDGATQFVPFSVSEWPLAASRLKSALEEAVDSFTRYVNSIAPFNG